jgi:hypothetical protein|nr:MAG TPA: hypothetical protein [Caudoviricetes sp.]
MKSYSEEEISKIVSDCSNTILETNMQSFIDEALDIAKKGKSNNETILEMFVLIYHKTQQNCCDTITEVLNKILND